MEPPLCQWTSSRLCRSCYWASACDFEFCCCLAAAGVGVVVAVVAVVLVVVVVVVTVVVEQQQQQQQRQQQQQQELNNQPTNQHRTLNNTQQLQMIVSRFLVYQLFRNQILVIIGVVCTKSTIMTIVFVTVIVTDNNQ